MLMEGILEISHPIVFFCWWPISSALSVLFWDVQMAGLSLIQFSHSVVSDSLWPHEPLYTRPPCPSPNPGVHPNPCPLSRWCHPTISSSVVPFSCPQSFPASGSFQMSQLLHQVAKVLEFQHQHQSLKWTPRTDLLQNGLVGSPCSPRDYQESSPTPQF